MELVTKATIFAVNTHDGMRRKTNKNPYILRMEKNYRSTAQIVDKAQTFISKNKGRYKKNMTAERGDGDAVLEHWQTRRDERF